jgi:hypothetical protein
MADEAVVEVREVKGFRTRSGNTRFVLRDEQGNEYTTFKEEIARAALAAEGRRARIRFHETERNGYTNVYLDAVETLDEEADEGGSREVEEVAWRTAVDAAPYLVGEHEAELPAEELFEKLQPFKELVADDIRDGGDETE